MSPISPKLAPGFEAFPAVYRAPSLFWHRPGYEFPGVRGLACFLAGTDSFAASLFGFTGGETSAHPEGCYRAFLWLALSEGSEKGFFGLP